MRGNIRRVTVGAALIVAAAAAAPAAAPAASASGCPWLEFTRYPAASTFPETNTQVYQCLYAVGSAHETVLYGRPPRARFWSFAVLDQARREVDSIIDSDVALRADGSYRIVIAAGCGGRPNCLDVAAAPASAAPGLIFYRVYVPEGDRRGGVALPTVSYEAPGGPGHSVAAAEPAGAASATASELTEPLAPGGAVFDALAAPSGLDRPVAEGQTGADPPAERFQGLGAKQVSSLEGAGAPAPVIAALRGAIGQGGFGATADNAYVTVAYDMSLGNLVLRAMAPTYRAQAPTPANDRGRGDGSEQVRFWSLCTTQATRPVDCARDETVALEADGSFAVVVAPSCPVAGYRTCLRAGRLSAAGRGAAGSLLYRNTLAAPGFHNAEGPAVCPGDQTMYCGAYAPRARYVPRP